MKFLSVCFLLLVAGLTESISVVQHGDLLSYVDEQGRVQPVQTRDEWNIKRGQIVDSMEAAMGPLPDRQNVPPMDIVYTDSLKTKQYVRYTIWFTVAQKERISAYLYVPLQHGTFEKRPAMLALHSTFAGGKEIVDGQSPLPNRAYAKEMAERGYVVIAPDYPSFGGLKDYDFKADRYQSATMKGIVDNMRCVDLLQARADVDPERIGVIGHSLGGHNAIFSGVFDRRLKVIVSSSGWTLMHDYFNGDTAAARKNGGKLWPWAQERYMPLIRTKYHLDADRVPFDFDEAIAALAPRAFFTNAPEYDANFNVAGVRKGIARVKKVYRFLGAEQNVQVRYPSAKHDFPPQVRGAAYHFVDSVFGFKAGTATPYSYLDNPSYLARLGQFDPPADPISIVMLGNSLTARGNWQAILQRKDVVNQGIGSDITLGFINRLSYVFRCHPKICIIEGGANDLVHDVSNAAIINNLSVLIDTLRRSHIVPVLNTVTIATEDYQYIVPKIFNRDIARLNMGIKQLAIEKKVELIDLNPFVSAGIYREKQYAVKDGIHYTDKAYAIWGREIGKILVVHQIERQR